MLPGSKLQEAVEFLCEMVLSSLDLAIVLELTLSLRGISVPTAVLTCNSLDLSECNLFFLLSS